MPGLMHLAVACLYSDIFRSTVAAVIAAVLALLVHLSYDVLVWDFAHMPLLALLFMSAFPWLVFWRARQGVRLDTNPMTARSVPGLGGDDDSPARLRFPNGQA